MAYSRKTQRLLFISVGLGFAAIAVVFMAMAFSSTAAFFRTPSELVGEANATDQRYRLGGLVEAGSVVKLGSQTDFKVTDCKESLLVRTNIILPDLFREGQGVVAEGKLSVDGVFVADKVLAKHDENYMPKEVADTLKQQGVWQGGGGC
jgi:cytochrome c-type biogenesis protein CcmE